MLSNNGRLQEILSSDQANTNKAKKSELQKAVTKEDDVERETISELKAQEEFDATVINDNIDSAVLKLEELIFH